MVTDDAVTLACACACARDVREAVGRANDAISAAAKAGMTIAADILHHDRIGSGRVPVLIVRATIDPDRIAS